MKQVLWNKYAIKIPKTCLQIDKCMQLLISFVFISHLLVVQIIANAIISKMPIFNTMHSNKGENLKKLRI